MKCLFNTETGIAICMKAKQYYMNTIIFLVNTAKALSNFAKEII